MITETKEYKDWLEREAWNHPLSETNFKRIARKSAIKTEQLLDRDSFAMEFHNWIKKEYVFTGHKYYSRENEHAYGKSLSELLEIFKKQR